MDKVKLHRITPEDIFESRLKATETITLAKSSEELIDQDVEKAIYYLELALTKDSDSKTILDTLGSLYFKNGNLESAYTINYDRIQRHGWMATDLYYATDL